jgi:hypothetical protein
MGEGRISRNDLDQAAIERLDISREASDAAAGKTPQHRIFQQSAGILGGDFFSAEPAANSKYLRAGPERWPQASILMSPSAAC